MLNSEFNPLKKMEMQSLTNLYNNLWNEDILIESVILLIESQTETLGFNLKV